MFVNLQNKKYSLDTLFGFETLKEILYKLAISQDRLEREMKNMKDSNKQRDTTMENLKNLLQENLGLSLHGSDNIVQNENNENQNINNTNEQDLLNQSFENSETNNNQNINNENNNLNDNNIVNENENNNKNNDIKENNDIEKNNEINNIPNNQSIYPEPTKVEKSNISKDLQANQNLINGLTKQQFQKSQKQYSVSPELVAQIAKQAKENKMKIAIIETKLKKESSNIKTNEENLKNHDNQNISDFKILTDKLEEIIQKNIDFDKKLENLEVKTSEFDIFSMFKDNGDGTIDATKVMVRALEEKIFKKFELLDKRYKLDAVENMKMKTGVEKLNAKSEMLNKEITKLNEVDNQTKENLDNLIKNCENENNEIKNTINNDVTEKINSLQKILSNLINNKIVDIEKKITDFKKLSLNMQNTENLSDDAKKLLNSDLMENIDSKLEEVFKKIGELETKLKIYMVSIPVAEIQNNIKELMSNLQKKISKEDLKELYNLHLMNVNEISNLTDRLTMTYDELKRASKDVQNIFRRIETMSGNITLLQNAALGGSGDRPVIDFSKYIDNHQLTENLKPVYKQIEKVYNDLDSLRYDVNDGQKNIKNNLKTEIKRLEDDMNKQLNDIKIFNQKKFIEKIEFGKTIKNIDVQIKSLTEDKKKAEGESWLLAKQPLKCFNCASCEAMVKNEKKEGEYVPWKKYPQGEKIHRMGQGFSHMLQMMTSEFIKSLERNEYSFEGDNNYNNSSINEKNVNAGFTINNKEQMNPEIFDIKRSQKIQLPKVKNYKNRSKKLNDDNIPISDSDNQMDTLENDKIKGFSSSPRIMKIVRKKKYNDVLPGEFNTVTNDFNSKTRNEPIYNKGQKTYAKNDL